MPADRPVSREIFSGKSDIVGFSPRRELDDSEAPPDEVDLPVPGNPPDDFFQREAGDEKIDLLGGLARDQVSDVPADGVGILPEQTHEEVLVLEMRIELFHGYLAGDVILACYPPNVERVEGASLGPPGLVLRPDIVYSIEFRMKLRKRVLIAWAGCLLLAAATHGSAPAKKKITILLERKEIREVKSTGLILVFYLEIANAERSTYSLVEYDYRVVVQDTDYFALRTALEEPIAVAAGASTRISLPLRITYPDLLERVPTAADGPKALCYVIGQMVFADSRGRQEKIPFAFSGEFPVYRQLDVGILPLEVRTLTIGGADFMVSFSLRNRNSFEMILGRLTYRLDLDGQTAAEGAVAPGKRIESQGEIMLSLPHMLEFFEVGRELHDILQKPSVAAELSIQAGADSIWGEIEVDSVQKSDIQINRPQ